MKRRSLLAILTGLAMQPLVSPAFAKGETGRDLLAGAWLFYRAAFVSPEGRVIDNANGNISHSEGQGYGMLLAVAADDRPTFDSIWNWTQRELMVRDDALAAWKWDPASDPPVADSNNASDGDLLIAWALLRAYRQWSEPSYFSASEAIVIALDEGAVVEHAGQTLLLPGVDGFMSEDPETDPVFNLSYWVFPALKEMAVFGSKFPSGPLIESGLAQARQARFGPDKLPADWMTIGANGPKPSEQFPPTFGYNAIRVPLYLAWYDGAAPDLLTPFADLWAKMPEPSVVDLISGKPIDGMQDVGYLGIVDLVDCATGGTPDQHLAQTLKMDRYYPSTLSMLSLLAMVERYPQCLDAR